MSLRVDTYKENIVGMSCKGKTWGSPASLELPRKYLKAVKHNHNLTTFFVHFILFHETQIST